MSSKLSVTPAKTATLHSTNRIAVVFPGQGSQAVGMLGELSERYPIVQETFDESSQALGFDLWQIINNENELVKTQYTQPALLTASIAIWRILREQTDIKPIYLAGHSLGEYSALCAAGVISLADAVNLVHVRGKYMQEAVAGLDTKMAAILGLENNQVISICEQINETNEDVSLSPANFNSPGQVVVAGNAKGVDALGEQIQCMGKRMVPLKVSVPSHCSLMEPASEKLAVKLENSEFHLPQIPVIQNRHAVEEKTIQTIKQSLVEQLSHPVLWTQTMQRLSDKHINVIIECGAGTVLSNLTKRQETPIPSYPTDKPARIKKLLEVLL